MFADTDAVRALGAATAAIADDLAAVAAALAALPSDPALGPVAARFAVALTEAADAESDAAMTLSRRLAGARGTAYAAAAAYDAADAGAAARIAGG